MHSARRVACEHVARVTVEEEATLALKTVERLGDLLDLFTPERTEWTLADVARALGVPRSTAHGLLVSVASTGIVQAMGNGRYRLGPRIAALNEVQMQQRELRLQRAGSEVLRRLANETWETSNLGILAGPVIVYIDTIPGRHHVTVTGTRLGAARTAISKVLIARSAAMAWRTTSGRSHRRSAAWPCPSGIPTVPRWQR